MLFEGVPAEIRSRVWPLAIGNSVRCTPEMFRITLTRARVLKEYDTQQQQQQLQQIQKAEQQAKDGDTVAGPAVAPPHSRGGRDQRSLAVIDADLARTFPGLKLFGGDGHWSADLRGCQTSHRSKRFF